MKNPAARGGGPGSRRAWRSAQLGVKRPLERIQRLGRAGLHEGQVLHHQHRADPRGRIDVCYPQGQSTSATLAAGPARSLPDAVRADDVLGEARFVALRCDHGFSASEARQIVQGDAPPAGCVSEEVVLDKVPR